MTLVNYRTVAERFSHIDADFVGASVSLPEREARYAVHLYPWWEHPRYLEARAQNRSWRFGEYEEGKATVTVIAHNVYESRLSQSENDVINWWFTDEHPLLWGYHPSYQVLCASPLTPQQTGAIIDLVRAECRHDLNPYQFLNVPKETATFYEWTASKGFVLGNFPTPLYRKVIAYLDAIGAHYLGTGEAPDTADLPVLFMVDNDDYIIATDFTVDVPEFIHKPGWFTEA